MNIIIFMSNGKIKLLLFLTAIPHTKQVLVLRGVIALLQLSARKTFRIVN
jgi:mannitol/fructose-specific phosphotransferase system IIA component (Ntr-type)